MGHRAYIHILFFILLLTIFSCKKIAINHLSKVHTDSVLVSGTTLTAYGKIVDISDNGITKYGFCFGMQDEPTIFTSVVEINEPSATGEFYSSLDNINFEQTYYIRAFASDGENIIYGNTLTFSVAAFNGLAVTTLPASILSTSSVNIEGNISGTGSLVLQDFGFCWSQFPAPTISSDKISFGQTSQDTLFFGEIQGLSLSVPYFVRAYAILDNNTVFYGNEQNFTIPVLVVQTDTFDFPNTTDATLTGNIINLGVNSVTDHGFCWSYTTSQPSLNDQIISLGSISNTGIFAAPLYNILTGITYYYRAYATDGIFVKYGTIKNFTK